MSYVTDPIGDLLTRMRNAQMARKNSTVAPWSRLKQSLCELLKNEEWLQAVNVTADGIKKTIEVTFVPGKKLTLTRISKPGRRVYSGSKEFKPILQGFGIAIVSTSQGLMTDREARKKNIGGEVLCTIS